MEKLEKLNSHKREFWLYLFIYLFIYLFNIKAVLTGQLQKSFNREKKNSVQPVPAVTVTVLLCAPHKLRFLALHSLSFNQFLFRG